MATQVRPSRSIDGPSRIRVQLLGPFLLECEGQQLDVASRKARALVAFVALRGGAAVPRGILTALLWGDRSEAQARASLRQTLSELRAAFNAAGAASPLIADVESVAWATAAASVDALRLAELGKGGADDAASLLSLGIPCGELMEGFALNEAPFEQWLAGERQRFRQILCAVLLQRMNDASLAGSIDEALQLGLALLSVDALQELVHRAVMKLYEDQGRRDAALAQYERLKHELLTQLGVQPEAETSALARAIAAGRLAATLPPVRPSGTEATEPLSIAVLPFLTLSDDRQHGFFADGITEDIIGALTRVSELFVISRSSSFAYRGRAIRAELAARELGVRYILEGSVRIAGDRVRVNAQLIDGANSGHVWADRFDGNLDDIFAVQDEITRSIAVSLQVTLTKGESARLWEGQTRNLRAWEAMTLGRQAFYRFTTVDNFMARQHLEEAIRLDPGFTGAIAQLGISHYWDARYSVSLDRDKSQALAEEQVARIMALAPESAAAYQLRAFIAFLRGHFDETIALCSKAAALAPSDCRILGYLGLLHVYGGSPLEGDTLLKLATRLSPHPDPWIIYFSAVTQIWLGKFEEAIQLAQHYVKLDPDEPYGLFYLAVAQETQENLKRRWRP